MYKKNNVSNLIESFIYLFLFLILAFLVKIHFKYLFKLDNYITNFFNLFVNHFLIEIFKFISIIGNPVTTLAIVILISLILIFNQNYSNGIFIGFTFIFGDIVAFIIKHIVKRPRPNASLTLTHGYSFPSGHVFGTTLLLILIIYLIKFRIKNENIIFFIEIISVIWILLVLLSRIYLRAHYFSDTIGSILLALGIWKLCKFFFNMINSNNEDSNYYHYSAS